MEIAYQPRIDSEIESLVERINPPRVCVDNNSDSECTLIKVDSANKYGILLDMVQVLADLDLVISKTYTSSDGGWFMDVFHVTDQLGNKLTDPSLIRYIQQAICSSRTGGITKEMQSHLKLEMLQRHVSTIHTAFEITGFNRPGLLSDIFAVLSNIACHVTAAVAWTHHELAAMVIYMEDGFDGGYINDPIRKGQVKDH